MPTTNFDKVFRIKPGKKFKLGDIRPDETLGWKDEVKADALQDANVERISELQKVFYADNRHALLIVLQGMDTSGKDGTIRHLLTGVNPMGVSVSSFKTPTAEELDHDYLWRVHHETPRKGEIGVFNRSHYENVLVVRVHGFVPPKVWKKYYKQINAFERYLVENGTVVLKFMLHISKDEQRKRLQERVDDPKKNWKMSLADLDERKLWDAYQEAYEDAINECSTEHAPWHVIPSDKKWFRNLAISQIVADTMEGLELEYPKATFDPRGVKVE
jgi:PPK2 family polyphosphate:nucleotide phosphotransferase